MSHQQKHSTKEVKSPHITYEQRIKIEAHLSDGLKPAEIAKKLQKDRTTIVREINLGLVEINHYAYDKVHYIYSAEIAQKERDYRSSRKGAGLKISNNIEFSNKIEELIKRGFSPYAALQDIRTGTEDYGVDICTKTLYNYIEKEIFLDITNRDLPCRGEQKKRGYRRIRCAENNKRGTSISERPESIEKREEPGHWEIDLVVGKKGTKPVILTLVERKSRKSIYVLLKDKSQDEVKRALRRAKRKHGGDFSGVFKTITADNGPEFLDFEGMKKAIKCDEIYYAHPYSSWERGTNENGNRMLRRFIPRGTDLGSLTAKRLQEHEDWINNYPRKILGGNTANMVWQESIAA